MRGSVIFWIGMTAAVMLLLPWMAVAFVKGDGGMAVCFVLFYGVNPIYSVIAGISAGKDRRRLWLLPVMAAALFLLGAWIFFDMGEVAFILYAAVYLILGILAMLASSFKHNRTDV